LAATNPLFERAQHELQTFAKLRNAIVHTHLPNAAPIATPNEAAVAEYEKMVAGLLYPPPALSVAIALDNIFTTGWDERVRDVVAVMNEHVYTHAPILRDGAVVGVFSENTLFSSLAAHAPLEITDETRFEELREFLALDRHASEFFVFVPETATLADLLICFRKNFAEKKRLAAVFITENGRDTGRLRGLVTAWDIAGH
jgi:CBS domain-containing protein